MLSVSQRTLTFSDVIQCGCRSLRTRGINGITLRSKLRPEYHGRQKESCSTQAQESGALMPENKRIQTVQIKKEGRQICPSCATSQHNIWNSFRIVNPKLYEKNFMLYVQFLLPLVLQYLIISKIIKDSTIFPYCFQGGCFCYMYNIQIILFLFIFYSLFIYSYY